MASLFVIQGRDQGTRFQLDDAVHTLGRTQANSIRLHDTEVSREHAELVRQGDAYRVRDLGSSNGTFVNGRQVSDQVLRTGDQMQLGRSLLLYTGAVEGKVEDLLDKIDIVPRVGDDGSRIVATLAQTSGSDWFLPGASDSANPWLASARSNLQIMYRTALAVSHTMDIDQLLTRIMEMIFDWVDADRGCIMLVNLETGKLEPKVRRQRRGDDGETISISQTILDFVMEHKEGVLTTNAREDERWDPAQSIVSQGVREAICVPMQGRYQVVGLIYIDTAVTPKRRLLQQEGQPQFNEEHLRLMIAIAHQAALAVEDTSYYKALVQAERLAAVGQTIASLSHHIKNILQGVSGGSYLIELGLGDHDRACAGERDEQAATKAVETIRKGWGIVERNQDRISTLVMDMLTFSKERKPEPKPANLNAVAADVVELMQARAKDLGVKVEFTGAKEMPTLLFDPEALHRAILNVVTNAIDACEGSDQPRVRVTVHYDSQSHEARVRVEDNGPGIEPDDLEAIFTVFVSRKGGRGTGLGLPVSQKILEEHNGQIRCESEPGKGARFTLEFPATEAGQEEIDDDQRGTKFDTMALSGSDSVSDDSSAGG